MSVYIGKVETLRDVKPDKATALKILEEAAEVFGAWQMWAAPGEDCAVASAEDECWRDLVGECADVIQETCNLLAALGVEDAAPRMRACAERNRGRWRM